MTTKRELELPSLNEELEGEIQEYEAKREAFRKLLMDLDNVPANRSTEQVTIELPAELLKTIDAIVERTGFTRTDVMSVLVADSTERLMKLADKDLMQVLADGAHAVTKQLPANDPLRGEK